MQNIEAIEISKQIIFNVTILQKNTLVSKIGFHYIQLISYNEIKSNNKNIITCL